MLAYLGVQNLRHYSNSSLSVSPRKALLENVERIFTRGMKIYTVARAQAAFPHACPLYH